MPEKRLHSEKRKQLSSLDQAAELLEHFKPTYISRGGEHAVYGIPSHPEYVVKASLETTERIARWQRKYHLSPETVSDELRQAVGKVLAEDQRLRIEMRSAFGKEHLLPQKSFFKQIPLTSDMPDELSDLQVPFGAPSLVWSIVRIQEKTSWLEDPKRLQLVSGYAESERPPLDAKTYWQITDHLLDGTSVDIPAEEAFLQIQKNKNLHLLLDAARKDPQLAEQLRDCLRRTIAYSQATHETLDLAGQDNLIFGRRSDGSWNYLLVDALYGGKLIDKVSQTIYKLHREEELERGERNRVMNGFNFVRTVNGLAEIFSLTERVRFSERVTELPEAAKERLYEELKEQIV